MKINIFKASNNKKVLVFEIGQYNIQFGLLGLSFSSDKRFIILAPGTYKHIKY